MKLTWTKTEHRDIIYKVTKKVHDKLQKAYMELIGAWTQWNEGIANIEWLVTGESLAEVITTVKEWGKEQEETEHEKLQQTQNFMIKIRDLHWKHGDAIRSAKKPVDISRKCFRRLSGMTPRKTKEK